MSDIPLNLHLYGATPGFGLNYIDGDPFYVCLPNLKNFIDLKYLILEDNNYSKWSRFWKQANGRHAFVFADDYPAFLNLGLGTKKDLLEVHTTAFWKNVVASNFIPSEVIPCLLPMDSNGNWDTEALKDLPNGTISHGGTLYVDKHPIHYSEMPKKDFGVIWIGDTVEGLELPWFSFNRALYGAFSLKVHESFNWFQSRWV